jgi:hypothetical protein
MVLYLINIALQNYDDWIYIIILFLFQVIATQSVSNLIVDSLKTKI